MSTLALLLIVSAAHAGPEQAKAASGFGFEQPGGLLSAAEISAALRGREPNPEELERAKRQAAEHSDAVRGKGLRAGAEVPLPDESPTGACLETMIPRFSTIGSGVGVAVGTVVGGIVGFLAEGDPASIGLGITGGAAVGQAVGTSAGTATASYYCTMGSGAARGAKTPRNNAAFVPYVAKR